MMTRASTVPCARTSTENQVHVKYLTTTASVFPERNENLLKSELPQRLNPTHNTALCEDRIGLNSNLLILNKPRTDERLY